MSTKVLHHSPIESWSQSNPIYPIDRYHTGESYTASVVDSLPYHEPMKVEKYSTEFVHEEDGTIVINKRTLVILNVSKLHIETRTLYILTKEKIKTENEATPWKTMLMP